MAIDDPGAVIDALADPETLYVFGVLAARTSKLGLRVSDRAGSMPYVTPFGLMRETSLSRDVIEAAAERLNLDPPSILVGCVSPELILIV